MSILKNSKREGMAEIETELVTMTINDRLTNLSSSISFSNGSTRLSTDPNLNQALTNIL